MIEKWVSTGADIPPSGEPLLLSCAEDGLQNFIVGGFDPSIGFYDGKTNKTIEVDVEYWSTISYPV